MVAHAGRMCECPGLRPGSFRFSADWAPSAQCPELGICHTLGYTQRRRHEAAPLVSSLKLQQSSASTKERPVVGRPIGQQPPSCGSGSRLKRPSKAKDPQLIANHRGMVHLPHSTSWTLANQAIEGDSESKHS
eukprot:s4496_g7.t1